MQKSATIVHLDSLDGLTPLVGGYLKAFALAEPEVREHWRIELISATCRVSASQVLGDLVRRSPDLVAFSVYTWNAGLVGRILPALRGLLPASTRFLLGGVEVVNMAPRYVDRAWENVAVCNGEGERTFRELLLELGDERPDLARVGGITFPRDGEWLTTAGQPRIEDLTELVSPWLSGTFDDVPPEHVTLFETNRGCPFACEFCFWGGAIGQKVYRQDLERLRAELDCIARRGCRTLSLCDANFGLLPRDVELAEHIAALGQRHKHPNRVVFNSSKVHPERVEEISRIFGDAGLLTRHVFSLQTLSERALTLARRTGLALEQYRAIQRRLNAQHRASVVELVWPLPGETLESFRAGVDELLASGAQGLLIYPLIWLTNTGYEEQTEAYGVTTLRESDSAGDARIVVQTREVPFEDYLAGLRFSLATYLLHGCRGLYATLQLLDALGIARQRDVLEAFARWMDADARGPLAELWRERLTCFEELGKMNAPGILADAVLHGRREEFDRLLADFVASQPAWSAHAHGELVRAALDWDLLCRPYVFVQTALQLGVELQQVQLLERRSRSWHVRSPFDLPRLIEGLRVGRRPQAAELERGEWLVRIDHRCNQLFLLSTHTQDEHHWLCTLAVQEIARIEPRCTVEPCAQAAELAAEPRG